MKKPGNGCDGHGNNAADDAAASGSPVGTESVIVDQSSYDSRSGYNPRFLGDSKSLLAPLPVYSGATAHVLTFKSHGTVASVLNYWTYSVLMHRQRRLAIFAIGNVDANLRPKGAGRDGDRWYADTRILPTDQIGSEFYQEQRKFEIDRSTNPFDRGHLVRRLDAQWGEDEATAKRNGDDSFHWTNCSPQHYLFNQGAKRWLGLEDYVIQNFASDTRRACVINGPVFDAPLSQLGPDGRMIPNLGGEPHADPTFGGVAIPKLFFKIVVTQRSGALAAAAFLMSQEDFLRTVDRIKGLPALREQVLSAAEARLYQVAVRDVAALTDLDFGEVAGVDTKVAELAEIGPRVIGALSDIRLNFF